MEALFLFHVFSCNDPWVIVDLGNCICTMSMDTLVYSNQNGTFHNAVKRSGVHIEKRVSKYLLNQGLLNQMDRTLSARGKYFPFCTLKRGGTSFKNWQFGEPYLLTKKRHQIASSGNRILKNDSLILRDFLINIFLIPFFVEEVQWKVWNLSKLFPKWKGKFS